MSKLQIPPNKGGSTYGVQEQALLPTVESGQGRDMLFRRFLLWLGPTLVGGAFTVCGIALAAAQTWPAARVRVESAFRWAWALMTEPAFWISAAVLLGAYVGLLYWTWPLRPRLRKAPQPADPVSGEPEYITLDAAGRWLYANASERLKKVLKSKEPFDSIADHGAAFYTTQWQEGRCDLYGRWEAGLPMEKLDPKDGDFTAFSAAFGSDKRPMLDLSVMGRDLRPVLDFYEDAAAPPKDAPDAVNQWFTPEEARAKFVPDEQSKIDAAMAIWTPLSHIAEEARLASAAAPDDKALLDVFQARSTEASIAYHEVEKARHRGALALLAQLRDGKLIAKGVERVGGRAEDEKIIRTVYWNFFMMNLEEAKAGGQGHTYLAVRIGKPSRLAAGL